VNVLGTIISGLLSIAFLTLFERKVIAAVQRRTGPKVAGFYGLLQPFADGLKLMLKECIIPYRSNRVVFIMAPIAVFAVAFLNFSLLPLCKGGSFIKVDHSLLFIAALSSLQTF